MLQPFQHLYDNPEDIPMIPPAVAEYLQARLNAGYILQTGVATRMKDAGYSEAFVAGFLQGCQFAVQLIDDTENIRKYQQEEGIR